MNAPFLWLVLPLGVALVLAAWPWQRGPGRRRWRYPLGLAFSLTEAALAAALPIDQVITLGQWRFKIAPTLTVLGRRLELTDPYRPMLWLSFSLLTLWILGAWLTRQNDRFPSLALGGSSLLMATLAVQPFLYAAFFIQAAVLGGAFFFARQSRSLSRGLQRFIILQSLALPLLLYASWMLTGVETAPADLALTRQALIFLGAGLLLLLPAFPFHIWAPHLADDLPPYTLAFWLAVFPSGILLFGLRFLENYAWLRENPDLSRLLGLVGLLTLFIAGLLAAWQRRTGRLLAYAALALNGVTLLALSRGGLSGLYILPRHLALLLLGYGLERLSPRGKAQHFRQLQGLAYQRPLAAALGVLGLFALAGLPLFAPFPLYYSVWGQLAAASRLQALLFGLGLAGLTIGALRLLAVLLHSKEMQRWRWEFSLQHILWSGLLLLSLLFTGLSPHWLQRANEALVRLFPHLGP